MGIPLRPEEHAEQLSAGPCVIAEARAHSRDQRRVLARGTGQLRSLDELEDHVAVADLADEAGEPFEAAVERTDQLALPAWEQPLPESRARDAAAASPDEARAGSRGRDGVDR